jgi:hypothetical protein
MQGPSNPFFDTAPARELTKFIAYALYNFFGLAALLALVGLVTLWQKRCWEILPAMLWLLLMVLAGITSSIPDKFNIYVLVYPVLAIAVGVGAACIEARWLRTPPRAALLLALLAITPPLAYIATIHATQRMGVDMVGARVAPYRDNAWYFMWPSKRGDVGPRRYGQEALAALDKNAILIADYTLWRPIYFLQQLEGARLDVRTVWVEPLTWHGSVVDYIQTLPCKIPVYIASDTPPEYYQLADIKKHYRITQTGVVFKVNRHCSAA